MEKANSNDTVKVKKKKDFLRWWKLIVMQVFVLILTAAVLFFTWADIVLYQANCTTYESTQFSQSDVDTLKTFYRIPKYVDVEFIKALQHPGWTQDMNYCEVFFYISRQDVELFIGSVDFTQWETCEQKDHYSNPIVFDDGQQYTSYFHLDNKMELGHVILVFKPQTGDRYLVYVCKVGTIKLDKQKRIAPSESENYRDRYKIYGSRLY